MWHFLSCKELLCCIGCSHLGSFTHCFWNWGDARVLLVVLVPFLVVLILVVLIPPLIAFRCRSDISE